MALLKKPAALEAEAEGEYVWEIPDLAALEKKAYSPEFSVGKYTFNLLMFPQGNTASGSMSLFLNYVGPNKEQPDWSCCAQFIIGVCNSKDNSVFVFKGRVRWPFAFSVHLHRRLQIRITGSTRKSLIGVSINS